MNIRAGGGLVKTELASAPSVGGQGGACISNKLLAQASIYWPRSWLEMSSHQGLFSLTSLSASCPHPMLPRVLLSLPQGPAIQPCCSAPGLTHYSVSPPHSSGLDEKLNNLAVLSSSLCPPPEAASVLITWHTAARKITAKGGTWSCLVTCLVF